MLEDEPVFTGLVCPQCGAHSDPPTEAVHGEIRCPRCLAIILFATSSDSIPLETNRVRAASPPLAEPPVFSGVRPAPSAGAADDDADEFRVSASEVERPKSWYVPPPLPEGHEDVADDDVEALPPPESLPVTFLSGAFSLVWFMSAVKQWIVLAVLAVVATLLGVMTANIFSGGPSLTWGAGVLFMFPAIAAGVWALAWGGAYLAAIVERTIYKHDQSSDWPEGDWRQRFGDGFRIVFLFIQALMVGGIVGGILSVAVPKLFWPVCVPITFLLFPILLLSALETNVVASPVSIPIWRSIRALWPAWAAFYALSGALWLAWWAVAASTANSSPWLVPQLVAPLWAAVMFVYARLLGRLAGYLVRHGQFLVPDEDAQHA